MAEAWSVEVRVVRVVQAGWPCRRCSMSLLRDGNMRRQTWHILGWPGVRLATMELLALGRVLRQGGGGSALHADSEQQAVEAAAGVA